MSANQLRIAAVKQLIVAYSMGFVQMIAFFVSAGHIDVRPWIFFGASFLHYTGSTIVQYKLNPALLVQRLKIKRAGSKTWDEVSIDRLESAHCWKTERFMKSSMDIPNTQRG